jgi:hypothetical protein
MRIRYHMCKDEVLLVIRQEWTRVVHGAMPAITTNMRTAALAATVGNLAIIVRSINPLLILPLSGLFDILM